MLASITPLGERSRGFSWGVTATAFAIGALCAGTGAGAMLGALGMLLPAASGWRGLALLAVLVAALLFDAGPLRVWLPSTRRQVNEDWMGRYRGWVYGVAFGAQLGVGIATIVTCAAIYAAAATALLSGSVAAGGAIGASFGAVRALSLLPARTARDAESLQELHRRLARLELPVRRAVPFVEFALLALVIWRVA